MTWSRQQDSKNEMIREQHPFNVSAFVRKCRSFAHALKPEAEDDSI